VRFVAGEVHSWHVLHHVRKVAGRIKSVTITAAADGSALGNPGPAGWAWYIDDDRWASGGWPHGTNNMGELMAVLDLLQQTAGVDDELVVICDSTYVINTITKWMANWKRKGWRKGDGQPVMNLEIVQALDAAIAGRDVRFEWVKGHTGHPLNEAADVRANAAAQAMKVGEVAESGPGFRGFGEPLPVDKVPYPLRGIASSQGLPETPEVGTSMEAEPDLFSLDSFDADSLSDEDEVIRLEKSFLTDEVRADPASVAALLHPDWIEVGKSGRVWTKADKLAEVSPGLGTDFELIKVERIAPEVIMVQWRGLSDRGNSRRVSVWVRDGNRWLMRYQQGTADF
jgi:ribonuclease HI